jgi:hypothetical protein
MSDIRSIDTAASTLTVPRNRVTGVPTTNLGNLAKPLTYDPVGGRGVEFKSGGTVGYFSTDVTTPASSVTVFCIRADLGANIRSMFGTSSNSGLGTYAPFNDGTIYWDFGGNGGSNRITWGGYSSSRAVQFWTFVAGTKGNAIYMNGVQRAVATSAITSTPAAFRICGGYEGNNNECHMYAIGISNREWSAEEVAAWYRDPYGMFFPEPSPLTYSYQIVAGGGGGGGAKFSYIWLGD